MIDQSVDNEAGATPAPGDPDANSPDFEAAQKAIDESFSFDAPGEADAEPEEVNPLPVEETVAPLAEASGPTDPDSGDQAPGHEPEDASEAPVSEDASDEASLDPEFPAEAPDGAPTAALDQGLAEEAEEAVDASESIAADLPQPEPEALVPILEAVLFAAPAPLTSKAFKKVFGDEVLWDVIKRGLALLEEQTRADGRGILVCEVAGGWQFLSREEYFPYVQRIARTKNEERLTPAAIETLAIVAYKQPVTRAEVDAVRGVSSGSLIRTLMDRKLVRVAGRAEVPGAPFQYGTTKRFLEHFGLRSTRDLPDPKELGRLLSERETDEAT